MQELSRKKPLLRNRVETHIEEAVIKLATDNPALGQVRVSNELRKKGLFISPGGVRSVWLRHDMETFKRRLKALETLIAQDGIILTDNQVAALERNKVDQEVKGEIETFHPGYFGAQDTYYVGTIKGVGRIYQQTFIDTDSKTVHLKLYDRKNALVSADILNDRGILFYEKYGIPLLRILTDRGTEFCGAREYHEYQLFLALEDIDHTRTRARSPQTNGKCECFHKTVQNEFYAIAFRKKIYVSIEQLQEDLDRWVYEHNCERTHTGKHCYGKTPMQTFLDSLHFAKEKMIDLQYEIMNKENHLSDVSNQKASDEMHARLDDTSEIKKESSVHFSLAEIEEDDNFAEEVNGQ